MENAPQSTIPSSIPSSRWVLVFLASFAVLMLANELMVRHFAATTWWFNRPRQHIAVENAATLENYVFNAERYSVVIAGSSAVTFMPIEKMARPWLYTIAQQGGSAMAGIEAVMRAPVKPKLLLIEMEPMFRGVDHALLDSVFDPIYSPLRRHFYGLRYSYNWTNLYTKSAMPLVPLTPIPTETEAQWQAKIADKVLPAVASYGRVEIVPMLQQQAVFDYVREKINTLTAQGVEVVFFHTPYDRRIVNSVFMKHWADYLHRAAPQVPIIPLPAFETLPLYTVDGTHMDPASANDYLNYLLSAAHAERFAR